ncbi:MAG: permease prefix domain 1-containing protein [Actinomycetota bacterium]
MRRPVYGTGAIGAYVAQLEPDLFGRARVRRRFAEEIQGHLEDALDRFIESGMPTEEAERRAVERFGAPRTIINGWAESKGIGVTTTFTRYGGLAGIFGVIGLVLSMVYSEISWTFSIGWFAEIALAFGAFLAIGMFAVYMPLRGKLGRFARIGFSSIIAGLIIGFGSSAMWFVAGGVAGLGLLIVGVSLFLVGAIKADVLPRGAFMIWLASFTIATVVGLMGVVTGIDTAPIAGGAGYLGFITGWVWLGRHMWNEIPADEPQRAATA